METRLSWEHCASVGTGSPVWLLLRGSRRNTHLGTHGKGVPVCNYMPSTHTIKHVESRTGNIPTARTIRSDLCWGNTEEGNDAPQQPGGKQGLQVQGMAPISLNSSEFTHLISWELGRGTPCLSQPPARSGKAAQGQPGAQEPEKHLGLGPDLSIQVLFYQLQRPHCVPTAAKRQWHQNNNRDI